jgi:hypothetical protein
VSQQAILKYYPPSLREKKVLMHSGVNEHEALIKAELDISKEYHIRIFDIKKLVRI